MKSISITNEYNYSDGMIILIKDIVGLMPYDTVTLCINGTYINTQKPNMLSFGILRGNINIKMVSTLTKTIIYEEYPDFIFNMSIIPIYVQEPITIMQPHAIKISEYSSTNNYRCNNIHNSYNYIIYNYDKNIIQELILPPDNFILSHFYHETCFFGLTNTNLLVLCGDMKDIDVLDDYIIKNGINTVKIYGLTKLLNHLRSNKYIISINYISYG